MTDINELMAKALVEQEYAKICESIPNHPSLNFGHTLCVSKEPSGDVRNWIAIDPFYIGPDDKKFGIACRQAHALEGWLASRYHDKWFEQSVRAIGVTYHQNGWHQWRLDRIRWCFEELAKK